MPKIDDDIVKRVIARASIVDVIGDFLTLRKTGVRYTALCPFHQDRHDGNFVVYPAKNCYKCFTCDAKGGPIEFLMNYAKMDFPDAIRYLGRKYGIDVDNIPIGYTLPPAPEAPPPLPMLELPMSYVMRKKSTDNTLCNWIKSLPWGPAQMARITNVFNEYMLGTSYQGHTIFWQIDELNRVRTGKMMLYKIDGHRDKEAKHNFNWIHSLVFRDPRLPRYGYDKQEMKQTLFGMHLLNAYPMATINIVESEKTAILMAIAYGNTATQLWMACGGKENLSRDRLLPLIRSQRKIMLFPDRDAVDEWQLKKMQLGYHNVTLNTQAVKDWWIEADGEKADIADVVIRMITSHNSQPAKAVGDIIKKNPNVNKLINKLNLTIT